MNLKILAELFSLSVIPDELTIATQGLGEEGEFFLYCTVCCNCENLKFATEPSKIFHSVHVTLDDKCMYIQYRERDGSSGGAENGILKRVSFPWRPNFQHFFITSGLPSSSHSADPLFGKKKYSVLWKPHWHYLYNGIKTIFKQRLVWVWIAFNFYGKVFQPIGTRFPFWNVCWLVGRNRRTYLLI